MELLPLWQEDQQISLPGITPFSVPSIQLQIVHQQVQVGHKRKQEDGPAPEQMTRQAKETPALEVF